MAAVTTPAAASSAAAVRGLVVVKPAMTIVPAVVTAVRSAARIVARIADRSTAATAIFAGRGRGFTGAAAATGVVAVASVVPIPAIVSATVLVTDVVPAVAAPMHVAVAMAATAMTPAPLGLGSRRAEQQRQTQHKTPGNRDANKTRHGKVLRVGQAFQPNKFDSLGGRHWPFPPLCKACGKPRCY